LENIKLTRILGSFSKEEIRDFEIFINSPYFNNGKYLVKFFREVKKFWPSFKNKRCTKEIIFSTLQPGQEYNDAYMRKLISNLTRLADEYLIYSAYSNETAEKTLALLKQYRQRGLDQEFDKMFINTEKEFIEISESDNKDKSFDLYRLYGNAVNYHLDRDYSEVLGYYQKEADSFVKYTVTKLLEMYGDMVNSRHLFHTDFNMPLLYEIIKNAEENGFYDDLTLKISTYSLLIELTQDEKHYQKLKDTLYNEDINPGRETELNAYMTMINFGIRKAHSGEEKYYHEIGNFYDKMLKKGVLTEDGYLQYYYFINIVTNRIRMKNYKAAGEFIREYSEKLHPDDRDDVVNFCLARLSFYIGNYEEALGYLAKINLQQSHIKLEVKNYLLMIYYELNMQEEAFYIIDSYKHYIKRDETTSNLVRQTNRNFLDLYAKLLRLKLSPDNDELFLLEKKIETAETINKKWLTGKVNELNKKRS